MGAPFLFGSLHFFLCVCYTGIYDRLFCLFVSFGGLYGT